MGGEELKWCQPAHHQPSDLILVHRVQLKPKIKAQISGRMVSSGTCMSENLSEEVDDDDENYYYYYYYYE